MQQPTATGLVSATDAKHIVMRCIHGASDKMKDAAIQTWATKSPEETRDTLDKPDVSVTNQRDKVTQLLKLALLNSEVKSSWALYKRWSAMVNGVEHSDTAIVFLTQSYLSKFKSLETNNCKREFDYAIHHGEQAVKKLKPPQIPVLPVLIDSTLSAEEDWSSCVPSHLMGWFYSSLHQSNLSDCFDSDGEPRDEKRLEYKVRELAKAIRRFTSRYDLSRDYVLPSPRVGLDGSDEQSSLLLSARASFRQARHSMGQVMTPVRNRLRQAFKFEPQPSIRRRSRAATAQMQGNKASPQTLIRCQTAPIPGVDTSGAAERWNDQLAGAKGAGTSLSCPLSSLSSEPSPKILTMHSNSSSELFIHGEHSLDALLPTDSAKTDVVVEDLQSSHLAHSAKLGTAVLHL
mmetsp:Transcript_35159/g.70121  ORF Transcript_35159/g.70121 Transcript_35159/m.70121 type:complete len:403 (-) Transcript_35159:183-1391(-)